jgi:hypothetical protein
MLRQWWRRRTLSRRCTDALVGVGMASWWVLPDGVPEMVLSRFPPLTSLLAMLFNKCRRGMHLVVEDKELPRSCPLRTTTCLLSCWWDEGLHHAGTRQTQNGRPSGHSRLNVVAVAYLEPTFMATLSMCAGRPTACSTSPSNLGPSVESSSWHTSRSIVVPLVRPPHLP